MNKQFRLSRVRPFVLWLTFVGAIGCRATTTPLKDEGVYLSNPPGVPPELVTKIKSAVLDEDVTSGTAFYINDEFMALTNFHVVSSCIERNLELIPPSAVPIRLNPPLDCGKFQLIAIPPDPFQRTSSAGFYGTTFQASDFLDWMKSRTDTGSLEEVLVGELEVDDWALIRVKPGADGEEKSPYLALSDAPIVAGQKLVSYGNGINLARARNLSLGDLQGLRLQFDALLQDPDFAALKNALMVKLAMIDEAIEYRKAQAALPEGERDYPDPDAPRLVTGGRFSVGSIKAGGGLPEWLTDLSLEYLRARWFPDAAPSSAGAGSDERLPIWLSAADASESVVKLLTNYKRDVTMLRSASPPAALKRKMLWRMRNLEARSQADLTHAHYASELKLLKDCFAAPAGALCKTGVQRIQRILDEQIAVWSTMQPTAKEMQFFENAERSIASVAASLSERPFNGKGFVSNVDVVSGNSGSPLVDIATGKVVGIHRAGPWTGATFYSEGRIHVDARRVREQLMALGVPMGG